MTAGAKLAPDGLFSHGSRMVVDASHVASVEYDGLSLVPIAEVFIDPGAVFLGFGEPNVYLALPEEVADVGTEPSWVKYAATMFWRQKSYVANTKGRVQGGILLELRELPADAITSLRAAMDELSGRRTVTCAHANAKVLDRAGFTSGGRSLERKVRPMALAEKIWQHGLEYKGRPVDLRFIRTGNRSLTHHFSSVLVKESTSPARLVKKLSTQFGRNDTTAAPVIEARKLQAADDTRSVSEPTAELRMGRPSKLGAAVGAYLGDHPIFEAIPDRDRVDLDGAEFPELNRALVAYPGKLSASTRLKKHLLFAPGPVRLIRRQLAQRMESVGSYSGTSLTAMLQLGPEDRPFIYNAIVTGSALRLARLENQNNKDNDLVNWVLAKHVLIAGYDPDVRFAGECWVTEGPDSRIVHLNNNSGTYKPSVAQTEAAGRFIRTGFGVPVEVHTVVADEPGGDEPVGDEPVGPGKTR